MGRVGGEDPPRVPGQHYTPSVVSDRMAGAGKKLHGNGTPRRQRSPTASVSDGGYGRPAHPTRVHAGQKYWPRRGMRRRALVVRSVGRDGKVIARRLDGARERVAVTRARLLATREDGQGRHFQFLGWSSRRYRTWAVVIEVHEAVASLVLPEWHPTRPVCLPLGALPECARRPGVWLKLTADLSAPAPGKLHTASLRVCEHPGSLGCSLLPGRSE